MDWPTTLPQSFLMDGSYKEQSRDASLPFETDTGPGKGRLKQTEAYIDVTGSMIMTITQAGLLDTFYYDTLNGGTLPFNFPDIIAGTALEYSFTAVPEKRSVSYDKVKVMLSMKKALT